jgi:hypothetical protein
MQNAVTNHKSTSYKKDQCNKGIHNIDSIKKASASGQYGLSIATAYLALLS